MFFFHFFIQVFPSRVLLFFFIDDFFTVLISKVKTCCLCYLDESREGKWVFRFDIKAGNSPGDARGIRCIIRITWEMNIARAPWRHQSGGKCKGREYLLCSSCLRSSCLRSSDSRGHVERGLLACLLLISRICRAEAFLSGF